MRKTLITTLITLVLLTAGAPTGQAAVTTPECDPKPTVGRVLCEVEHTAGQVMEIVEPYVDIVMDVRNYEWGFANQTAAFAVDEAVGAVGPSAALAFWAAYLPLRGAGYGITEVTTQCHDMTDLCIVAGYESGTQSPITTAICQNPTKPVDQIVCAVVEIAGYEVGRVTLAKAYVDSEVATGTYRATVVAEYAGDTADDSHAFAVGGVNNHCSYHLTGDDCLDAIRGLFGSVQF